jgi:hypothetical protein
MEGDQKKISKVMSAFLVAVAVATDLIQYFVGFFAVGVVTIPLVWIVNGFINIIAWLLFYIWFTMLGVSFVHPKKFLTMGTSFIADTVAGGFLPAWTVCVLFLLYFEKLEKVIAKVPGGDTAVKMASVKMVGKPPVLQTKPSPSPKGPPPIPPRPGEDGYGDPSHSQTYKLRQNIANFQNQTKNEAEERARAIHDHEIKYREDIEKEIKEYGSGKKGV